MTFSALSFYYFILHFFFLARYWSTVRLTRSVNTDWHHGLCSRGGNKVSTQCFLYSVSLLLHQKTLAKSHLYFPCSWSFVIILIPTFSGFLYICISSAIVYFDPGTKYFTWFVRPNWDLRSNSWLSEESLYKLSLRYYMTCPVTGFPHTTGFLTPTVVLDSRTS